ncbi:ComEC/Rec2 family competence protein [Virgibacillus sp. DJP39]|uniref:ComEC/Rec2 family competence protein n=1 Tax=Virgibacillus sp. DJP39 TaxID=3409790 RepID=UPI003BB60E49
MRSLRYLITFSLILLLNGQPIIAFSSEQQTMDVHFIDVGQGDSILIQTPSNKTILIDGGTPDSGNKILDLLEKKHILSIDLLVVTHPDIDHIGGLPKLMKSINIDKILDSGKLYTTKTYRRYINQIGKQKIPVEIAKKNQVIKLDPVLDIKVLNTYEPFKNNNESSIALKVTYKEMDFLFMSDVEKEQEQQLVKNEDLQAEFLKVAHHGSQTSTSIEFLEKVRPKVAIITYSKQNDYGHPVGRVIQNLYKVNSLIYSTAVFGTITISTNGFDYYLWTEKSPMSGIAKERS